MITGRAGYSVRRVSSTRIPSIPGILMSRNTRSIPPAATRASADGPSAASATANFSYSSVIRIVSRMVCSSSTTSTVFMITLPRAPVRDRWRVRTVRSSYRPMEVRYGHGGISIRTLRRGWLASTSLSSTVPSTTNRSSPHSMNSPVRSTAPLDPVTIARRADPKKC